MVSSVEDVVFDLAIIGAAGLPPKYGGFETLADHLVRRLAGRNKIVVAHSLVDNARLNADYFGAILSGFNWKANGWQSIFYDIHSLLRLVPQSRTILILGVSGCLVLPIVRLIWPQVRLVTNLDGAEWRREKWGLPQRAFLRLSEWAAVRFSHVVIADNEVIRQYLRDVFHADSELIAYGGDGDTDTLTVDANAPAAVEGAPYFFSVCRVEPENNIHVIAEAFSRLPAERVVLIGNWNASEYGRNIRLRYSEFSNLVLLDPIYDRPVLDKIRKGARAHVHGHSAGGTNPTLVEAMSAGLATLCFDVSYNRHTTHGQAFYWANAGELVDLIESVDCKSMAECAVKMKRIADEHYTWEEIAYLYREVLNLS